MKDSTPTKVRVVRVNNPFNKSDRDIINMSVEEATEALSTWNDGDLSIRINGSVVDGPIAIRDGDEIVAVPVVRGGDNDKAVINMVAMLAMAFIGGPYLAGVVGLEAGTMAYTIFQIAVIVGTSVLLSALTPKPDVTRDDIDGTPVFGWDPHTTQKPGIPIPRFYGENKVYGNVIAVHTEPKAGDSSTEIINILISLGMGPVSGIVTDQIFINDQLYGRYSEVSAEERKGEITQIATSYFSQTKPEFAVNVLVVNGTAQIVTTHNSDYDDLEVSLLFPRGCFYANDKGGLDNHTIGYRIEISESGAGLWQTLVEDSLVTAQAKPIILTFVASSTYTGGSAVTINRGTKYSIRVTKTTSDQSSTRYGDDVKFLNIREVLDVAFTYPRQALLAIQAKATNQLSGGMNISCIQKGLLVRVYNGSAWAIEWSDNPAWVLLDILTQPVISGTTGSYAVEYYEGMNPDQIDLDKFYELAQFCDETVPDGKGGTEKRITFNSGFDTSSSPWDAAMRVCQIARCVIYWNGTQATLAIDKADTAVMTFSDANIIEGSFKEMFLSLDERTNEIEIQFIDKDQGYQRTQVSIYDENITDYLNKTGINLDGATKSSEAWRAGMFRLLQNKLLLSTVEFEADVDAVGVVIGDVIYVQSSIPKWGEGGRVVSSTNNTVVTDRALTLESGTQKILVRSYDSSTGQEIVQERTILSVVGTTITVTSNWLVNPSANDVYAAGLDLKANRKYRVVNIDRASDHTVKISALEYNANIYEMDDREPDLAWDNLTQISASPSPITIGNPTWEDISKRYPADLIYRDLETTMNTDIPLHSGLTWTDNTPASGSVTISNFTMYYGGTEYAVTGGNFSNKYVYWDKNYSSGTQIQSTNDLSAVLDADVWCIGYNAPITGGTSKFYLTPATKMLHAGLIEAGTIDASHISAGSLTADLYQELRNTIVFTIGDSLDATYPLEFPFKITSEMTSIVSAKLSFAIMPYRAYSKNTTVSGGSTVQSTTSGDWPTLATTDSDGAGTSGAASGNTASTSLGSHDHSLSGRTDSEDGTGSHYHFLGYSADASNTDLGSHAHGLNSHTHSVPNHTHGLSWNGAAHTHQVVIPDHQHNFTYGIFEEAASGTVKYQINNGAGYGGYSSDYASSQTDLDISGSLSGTGWKYVKFTATNRCRIFAIIELKLDITA